MLKLPPEEVLLRWVQYHLAKDGSTRKVENLHSDLKDGEVYLRVLHSIGGGEKCPIEVLSNADPTARATGVSCNAAVVALRVCAIKCAAISLIASSSSASYYHS